MNFGKLGQILQAIIQILKLDHSKKQKPPVHTKRKETQSSEFILFYFFVKIFFYEVIKILNYLRYILFGSFKIIHILGRKSLNILIFSFYICKISLIILHINLIYNYFNIFYNPKTLIFLHLKLFYDCLVFFVRRKKMK